MSNTLTGLEWLSSPISTFLNHFQIHNPERAQINLFNYFNLFQLVGIACLGRIWKIFKAVEMVKFNDFRTGGIQSLQPSGRAQIKHSTNSRLFDMVGIVGPCAGPTWNMFKTVEMVDFNHFNVFEIVYPLRVQGPK